MARPSALDDFRSTLSGVARALTADAEVEVAWTADANVADAGVPQCVNDLIHLMERDLRFR